VTGPLGAQVGFPPHPANITRVGDPGLAAFAEDNSMSLRSNPL